MSKKTEEALNKQILDLSNRIVVLEADVIKSGVVIEVFSSASFPMLGLTPGT